MCQCSFCGNSYETKQLVEGKHGYICASCAMILFELFENGPEVIETIKPEQFETIKPSMLSTNPGQEIPKPHLLKECLDEYIIGQEMAKRLLTTEVYSHFRNINHPEGRVKKNNICLIGPSGSGKTYLAECLSKILNVPFVIADATMLSKTGYVGESVSSIFERLYYAAGENVELAERGVVFIDEIDKLSSQFNNSSSNRGDVGTTGVQQELLKVLEGSDVEFSVSKNRLQMTVSMNTKNVLFIVGGAFVGLDEQKQKKAKGFQSIGFNSHTQQYSVSPQTTHEDLIEYKMMPELVGRLSVIVDLYALTEDEIMKVLTEAKDSTIVSFKRRFATEGITLTFNPETLKGLAKEIHQSKIGIRGIDGKLALSLNQLLYETLSQEEVTEELLIQPEHLKLETSC